MAADGKEKKRKAGVATSTTDPPLKKSKSSRVDTVSSKPSHPLSNTSSTSSKHPEAVPKPRKGMHTENRHAAKIERLLSTPVDQWPETIKGREKRKMNLAKNAGKKAMNGTSDDSQTRPAVSTLTADGVNGVIETLDDESVETGTNKQAVSGPLQTKAQAITEKELEAEWENENDDDDDQAAALLSGFDSDNEDPAEDQGLEEGAAPLKIPKKASKKLKKAAIKDGEEGSGTVYIGRIPHGFYERGIKDYLEQFGKVLRLRLSRNRKTGASKHFAFVEFESAEVAKIVAEAMDNYLMYGHILKVKFAPQESLHPDVWKGANKRFKKIPHNKLEKRTLEAPKTKEQWETKISREQEKRERKKAELMKTMGYEYTLPEMKKPQEVLERKAAEEQKHIEAAPEMNDVPTREVPEDEVAVQEKPSRRDRKKKSKGAAGAPEAAAPESTSKLAPVETGERGGPILPDVPVPTAEPIKDITEPKDSSAKKREKKKDKARNGDAQIKSNVNNVDNAPVPAPSSAPAVEKIQPAPTLVPIEPTEPVIPVEDLLQPTEKTSKREKKKVKAKATKGSGVDSARVAASSPTPTPTSAPDSAAEAFLKSIEDDFLEPTSATIVLATEAGVPASPEKDIPKTRKKKTKIEDGTAGVVAQIEPTAPIPVSTTLTKSEMKSKKRKVNGGAELKYTDVEITKQIESTPGLVTSTSTTKPEKKSKKRKADPDTQYKNANAEVTKRTEPTAQPTKPSGTSTKSDEKSKRRKVEKGAQLKSILKESKKAK